MQLILRLISASGPEEGGPGQCLPGQTDKQVVLTVKRDFTLGHTICVVQRVDGSPEPIRSPPLTA